MSDIPLKKKNKMIDKYIYNSEEIIGTGSFSKVYKGFNKQTMETVAIKIIEKKYLLLSQYQQNIKTEIKILKLLKHPYIISLQNVFQTTHNIYIITQYCQSSLYDHIQNLKKFNLLLQRHQVIHIVHNITQALSYLHSNNIVHRDIKPSNILISKNKYKLADFGFAKICNQKQQLSDHIGSILYMAPQLLWNSTYTKKCDIWAMGIMFYQLLFCKYPWQAYSKDELIKKILTKQIKFHDDFRHQIKIKNIILNCLQYNQMNRYNIEQLKINIDSVEWIQKVNRSLIMKVNSLNSLNDKDIFNNQYICERNQKKQKENIPILQNIIVNEFISLRKPYLIKRKFFNLEKNFLNYSINQYQIN